MGNGEKIVASKNLLPSPSCTLSLYHLVLTFVGILLTFSPMHFLGFNLMPRRIPDFPDSFHYSLSYYLGHLLVCKSKNFGSWVYQLMIHFIVLSSFFLQDYISFIFSLVFFF